MNDKNKNLRELMGQARAVYFAMRHSAISYQEAKDLTEPILSRINAGVEIVAKKHKVKSTHVTFQNLGRNL